jgi:hypothetical protein
MHFAAFFLSLVAAASANIYITSPVAGTVFTAGENSTITWQDDGKSPSLESLGPCKVSVYIGNAIQQTSLQLIVDSVDVSKEDSVVFTPDGSIGPSGSDYFIRIESLSLKDSANPQYPALAFSAKFTLNGATGTFTPAEQSQIDGASTAPLGGSTATSSTSHSSTTSTNSSKTSSGSSKSSSTSTGSQPSATNGAAVSIIGNQFAAILAGAIGLAMFL